ncbi:MAG: T9SS type A sorting domain-containing protein [Bacteroidia bacterium]|nr:T9SS type A sorting domain-containing protein [Bacteroidia bacterium]
MFRTAVPLSGQIVGGTSNYFCWVNCYSPAVFTSSQSMTMQAGQTTSGAGDLSCDYMSNSLSGISIIAYTIFDVNTPADSSVFYIKFTYADGVDEIPQNSITDAYPNPTSGNTTIGYNLNPKSHASIALYNLIGTRVRNYELAKSSGSLVINTNNLNPGAYFYSFIIDGRVIKTSKLIVTR